jgi:hypothetical protein
VNNQQSFLSYQLTFLSSKLTFLSSELTFLSTRLAFLSTVPAGPVYGPCVHYLPLLPPLPCRPAVPATDGRLATLCRQDCIQRSEAAICVLECTESWLQMVANSTDALRLVPVPLLLLLLLLLLLCLGLPLLLRPPLLHAGDVRRVIRSAWNL